MSTDHQKTTEQLIQENEDLRHQLHELKKKVEPSKSIFDTDELFKALVTNTEEIIYVIAKDGRFLLSEGKGLSKLGLKAGQVVGQSVFDLYKDYPDLLESIRKCFEGETFYGEHKVGPVHFRNWYTPFLDENNQVVGLLGLSMDITEEVKAKEQIVTEKEFADLALDAQKDTFFLFDINSGKAIRWNKAFRDLSGFSDEEIASLPAPESYYSEEDLKLASKTMEAAMKTGTGNEILELITKNGQRIATEYQVALIPDEKGEKKYLISIGRDIRLRKESERALKKSEKRLLSLINNLEAAVLVHAPDTKITQSNLRARQMMGLSEEQLLGKLAEDAVWDFVDVNNKPLAIENYPVNQILGKRRPIKNLLIGINNAADKCLYWALVNGVPIIDASGDITEVLISFTDITERMQAEQELERQMQQLSDVVEGTNAGTWTWNIQNGELLLNELWAKMIGFTLSELEPIDVNTWEQNIHPDDLEMARLTLEKHFKAETEMYESIFRLKHKDNSWVWVQARGRVIEWTNDGKPLKMSGAHLNISKRIQAEEALRESEFLFRSLTTMAPVGIFQTDEKGMGIYVNNAVCSLTGMPAEAHNGLGWVKAIHSDDVENVRKKWTEYMQGEAAFELEFRFVNLKGEARWVTSRATALIDANGNVSGHIGMLNDITEQMKTNEELKKYREGLELMIKDRTQELESKNAELDNALKVFVGREQTIRELQRQIRELRDQD